MSNICISPTVKETGAYFKEAKPTGDFIPHSFKKYIRYETTGLVDLPAILVFIQIIWMYRPATDGGQKFKGDMFSATRNWFCERTGLTKDQVSAAIRRLVGGKFIYRELRSKVYPDGTPASDVPHMRPNVDKLREMDKQYAQNKSNPLPKKSDAVIPADPQNNPPKKSIDVFPSAETSCLPLPLKVDNLKEMDKKQYAQNKSNPLPKKSDTGIPADLPSKPKKLIDVPSCAETFPPSLPQRENPPLKENPKFKISPFYLRKPVKPSLNMGNPIIKLKEGIPALRANASLPNFEISELDWPTGLDKNPEAFGHLKQLANNEDRQEVLDKMGGALQKKEIPYATQYLGGIVRNFKAENYEEENTEPSPIKKTDRTDKKESKTLIISTNSNSPHLKFDYALSDLPETTRLKVGKVLAPIPALEQQKLLDELNHTTGLGKVKTPVGFMAMVVKIHLDKDSGGGWEFKSDLAACRQAEVKRRQDFREGDKRRKKESEKVCVKGEGFKTFSDLKALLVEKMPVEPNAEVKSPKKVVIPKRRPVPLDECPCCDHQGHLTINYLDKKGEKSNIQQKCSHVIESAKFLAGSMKGGEIFGKFGLVNLENGENL